MKNPLRIAGDVRERNRDASAGVNSGVESLEAEAKAGDGRPDRVGADAILVEVDEPGDRPGRSGGEVAASPAPRPADAGASNRIHEPKTFVCEFGVHMVDATGDAVGLVRLELARERIDEGVREGQREGPGADRAVAVGRRPTGMPVRH